MAESSAHREPAVVGEGSRLLVGLGDESWRVHGDGLMGHPELVLRPCEQVDVRGEARCRTADDGEEEAEIVACGAHDRVGAATDPDPRAQTVRRRREDPLILERRPRGAVPGDRLLLQQQREQVEPLLEQLLVLAQVEAEQREGLDERPAARDDLGPAVRDRVERGEALEHAHGVVGAEHGHRRSEPDALGSRRDGGEHDLGAGDREIGTMVLTQPEEVQSDPVRQHGLVDDVADHLRMRNGFPLGIGRDAAEGVEPEFDVSHVE